MTVWLIEGMILKCPAQSALQRDSHDRIPHDVSFISTGMSEVMPVC